MVPPGQFYLSFASCGAMLQNEASCCTVKTTKDMGMDQDGMDVIRLNPILKVHVVTHGANDPKVCALVLHLVLCLGLAFGSLHN